MFLVEFIQSVPSIKPAMVKGERALLDDWRYKRYFDNGWVCLIERIIVRRSVILESWEKSRVKSAKEELFRALDNIGLLWPEKKEILLRERDRIKGIIENLEGGGGAL